MTIETYTIVAHECGETGDTGLIIADMNTDNFHDGDIMVMFDAIGLAHDLTEHVNGLKSIGTVADELEALGAIWVTRGQYGELRRDNIGSAISTHDHLASDIVRMAQFNETIAPLDISDCDDIWYEDFEAIIEASRDGIAIEYDEPPCDIDYYLARCFEGMVLGAEKQGTRYEGLTSNCRFWNIHDALEPVFHSIEYVGQTFELTITDATEVVTNEVYDDES